MSDKEGKISEWLKEALKMAERRGYEVRGFRVTIQTIPNKTSVVVQKLRQLGVRVIGTVSNYIIVADVKDAATLDKIAQILEVTYISKEKMFYPMAYGLDELYKRIMVYTDPILSKLSKGDLNKLGISFKPTAEIPNPIRAMIENIEFLVKLWRNTPFAILDLLKELSESEDARLFGLPLGIPVLTREPWRLVTYTRTLMDAPEENFSTNLLVGVIDSGITVHPATPPGSFRLILYTVDLPMDTMGHGEWVSSCAFGRPTILSRYGKFVPVSSAKKILHVKIFTAFGPCTGYQVMKAMEIVAEKGCRVVNMSLGGPLTEPVDKDPECTLLDKLYEEHGTIFCVAAGNDDSEWKIASPGAALNAITVAAIDWDTMDVSSYSSRGPQGEYYKKNKDVFEEHLQKWGDIFLKPDVGGIGGDKHSQIVSAVTGWYDQVYDFVPDGWEMMIGTSMATPHVSGIVNLLLCSGKIYTAEDLKRVMKQVAQGEKNKEVGWGLLKYSYFGDESGSTSS